MEKASAKIKRPLWVVGLNIALALTVGSTQAFATDINSVEDLLTVSGNANYVLKVDLDLSIDDASSAEGEQLADVETSGDPSYISNGFTGTLDGGGRTISGLTKPLFNVIGGDGSAEISNLILVADTGGVTGRGILANNTYIGTEIEDVHGGGNINGGANDDVGGLVGTQGSSGEIRSSTFTGNVSSSASVANGYGVTGGLVGTTYSPIIDSSTSGSVEGLRYVGGLVGQLAGTEIINSHSTSDVEASEGNVGGLVGGMSGGSVESSSASIGEVVGPDSVGGLVGGIYGGIISESFSSGPVTGVTKVGGLVGRSSGGYIEQSFSNSDVEASSNGAVGGLVGYADEIGFWGQNSRGIVSGNSGNDMSTLSTLITNSYATGDVTQIDDGNDGGGVGGLVGSLSSGTILNSYSAGDVRGDTTVGGLVGRVYEYGANPGLTYNNLPYANYKGLIENSYSTSTINLGLNSANRLGGLVGILNGGKIVNSYATAGGFGIFGWDHIGGLVGDGSGFGGWGASGIIEDSFAYINGTLSADSGQVGGLAGSMGAGSTITNSFAYVSESITGLNQVGGLIGVFNGTLADITDSYASFGTLQASGEDASLVGTLTGDNFGFPVDFTEGQIIDLPILPSILGVVNTDDETEPFAVSSCFNAGLPYLTAMTTSYSNTCSVDEEAFPRADFSFLPTRALDGLSKSVGFKAAKSDLSKLDFAFLDQVKNGNGAQIIGAKLFTSQYLSTYLSVGSLLQLEINFESNKSLQMWVKSSDNQYVLVGDITFDKDGSAVLPGIEFKKGGSYEFIFVNSDKKDLTQPELVNKVSGLTVYVS